MRHPTIFRYRLRTAIRPCSDPQPSAYRSPLVRRGQLRDGHGRQLFCHETALATGSKRQSNTDLRTTGRLLIRGLLDL